MYVCCMMMTASRLLRMINTGSTSSSSINSINSINSMQLSSCSNVLAGIDVCTIYISYIYVYVCTIIYRDPLVSKIINPHY